MPRRLACVPRSSMPEHPGRTAGTAVICTCDGHHRPPVPSLPTLPVDFPSMKRTAIAVLLIFALSGAGALARAIDSPTVNGRSAGKGSPMSHIHPAMNHQCCHQAAAPRIEISLPAEPSGMPCGGQHSCCLRPGPVNSPEVLTTLGLQRPGLNRTVSVADAPRDASSSLPTNSKSDTDFLPKPALSTVLRI